MNKYIILIIIAVVLVGGGVVFSQIKNKGGAGNWNGQVKEFTITSQKDKWNFVPEKIEVNRGDKVILTIVNEDSYDHGFGMAEYGISQRMPAKQTIKIEFIAKKAGEFTYICSVPCGEGDVIMADGKKMHRTHFDMIGKLVVKG
jgi:plastocyanin